MKAALSAFAGVLGESPLEKYFITGIFISGRKNTMVAVKGIYQGGDTVKLSALSVPVNEPYEVVVAFLNPLQHSENSIQAKEKNNARRLEAFQFIMQYKGILPSDFDYKKELAEYRDERYGHFD